MYPRIVKLLLALTTFCLTTTAATSAFSANDAGKKIMPIISYLLFDDSGSQEPITPEEASRFLIQATYGATYRDIIALSNSTYSVWIDDQLNLPPTLTYDFLRDSDWLQPDREIPFVLREPISGGRPASWWLVSTYAEDQLRQRMALAWSEIFVVSNKGDGPVGSANRLFVGYYDFLISNAFTNFRDLLEKITLNGVMGEYLNMAGNGKAGTNTLRPDENYAREIMQLFSIGLWQLELDGTLKLDGSGQPIPTYDQEIVEQFAKVFTGWDQTRAQDFGGPGQFPNVKPMKAYPAFHDTTQKTLLNVPGFNPVLPPNRTPEMDLRDALDILFNHPNVAPFISKQLIQRFVTSNPTKGYVRRVATVFNNNGKGVRGDMQAVIKAILLDDEARKGHKTMPDTFGKFKEPLLRVTALWRALDMRKETVFAGSLKQSLGYLNQFPMESITVFNFFRPDFSPPGVLANNNLLAPEAQLLDLESVISMASTFYWLHQGNNSDIHTDSTNNAILHTQALETLVPDDMIRPTALVDRLDLVLLAGAMPDDVKEVLLKMHSQGSYAVDRKSKLVLDISQIITLSPLFYVQR